MIITESDIVELSREKRDFLLEKYINKLLPNDIALMLHYPPNGAIRYLMESWAMCLQFLGVRVYALPVGKQTSKAEIMANGIGIFLTCADEYYLSNVNIEEISECCLIGHLSSMENEWYEPVDFIVDFFLDVPEEKNGIPVHSLRFGCNPLIHKCPSLGHDQDVFFVGTNNPTKHRRTREWIVPALEKHLSRAFGPGFGQFIDIQDVPKHYAHSYVSLNYHTQGQIDRYININERAYIIPACGGFEVVDNPKALRDVYDDREIVSASTPDEYLSLVDRFVSHPEERLPYIYRAMNRTYDKYNLFSQMESLWKFMVGVL